MLALIFAAGFVARLTGGLLGLAYPLGLLAVLDAFSVSLLVAPLLWWCLRRQEQRRNQAEVELRHSELKFRRLFEGSADAMLLLDPDSGRFIDCNQAAAEMLDYSSREEVLRHRPAELSPPQQADGEASATKATAMIARALAVGNHRFEWIHRSDRRPEFPVEVLLTPIQLEGQQLMMTTWRDISARKQAESHHHLLSSALRSAANAFVITDRWGTIEWVNPAFTTLTGYTLARGVGPQPRRPAPLRRA
jgi:PAS domain S-box-containing protein